MLRLSIPLLLAGLLAAEEVDKLALEQPLTSATARGLRKRALKAWATALPVWDKSKGKKAVTPEEAAAAVPAIEEAVSVMERALRMEWSTEANREMAEMAKAWYGLRELVPVPEPPEEEAARKKYDSQRTKHARELVRGARRVLTDHLKARKYGNLYGRCRRCDGRKELRSPFGDKRPCTACRAAGMLVRRKSVLEAFWLIRSPLFRVDGRNASKVNRKLHNAAGKTRDLAPFVRTSTIVGQPENHDLWVRFQTREQVYSTPGAKRTEKVDGVYRLFRIGRNWYLYQARYDHSLLAIPKEEEE